jgi:hypothetical protein
MPVKGKVKTQLTKETILERCTEYDIYRTFFGPFEVNQVTCNHLRGEVNPSFIIGNKVNNGLTHKDFGSMYWRGDCFSLVMQIYSCDFNTALSIIDKELNLGISSKKVDKQIISWDQPKVSIVKPPPIIQITTRKPTTDELNYWKQYGIELEDLKRENIYFPKTIYRNKKRIPNSVMTFVYYYPEINKIKLYRPLAPKKQKNTPVWLWKWDTNIPFDHCENLSLIKNCKYAFLTKSKKDRLMLRKVLDIECIANVQAEDPACISDNTLNHFKQNSEYQVTIFDSDNKGKESSMWLTKEYGFKHCNVPDQYLKEGIKDFADLFRYKGKEPIIEHFTKKGFI